MRQLTRHLESGFSTLQILATDNPPPGEPNRRYDILGFNTAYNPAASDPTAGVPVQFTRLPVVFQNGPKFTDCPQNGVTVQALLAVIEDHLRGEQCGPEACLENHIALQHIQAALEMTSRKVDVPYKSAELYQRTA